MTPTVLTCHARQSAEPDVDCTRQFPEGVALIESTANLQRIYTGSGAADLNAAPDPNLWVALAYLRRSHLSLARHTAEKTVPRVWQRARSARPVFIPRVLLARSARYIYPDIVTNGKTHDSTSHLQSSRGQSIRIRTSHRGQTRITSVILKWGFLVRRQLQEQQHIRNPARQEISRRDQVRSEKLSERRVT